MQCKATQNRVQARPVPRNFQVGVLSLTVLARGESVTQRADGGRVLGMGLYPSPSPPARWEYCCTDIVSYKVGNLGK